MSELTLLAPVWLWLLGFVLFCAFLEIFFVRLFRLSDFSIKAIDFIWVLAASGALLAASISLKADDYRSRADEIKAMLSEERRSIARIFPRWDAACRDQLLYFEPSAVGGKDWFKVALPERLRVSEPEGERVLDCAAFAVAHSVADALVTPPPMEIDDPNYIDPTTVGKIMNDRFELPSGAFTEALKNILRDKVQALLTLNEREHIARNQENEARGFVEWKRYWPFFLLIALALRLTKSRIEARSSFQARRTKGQPIFFETIPIQPKLQGLWRRLRNGKSAGTNA